MDAKQDRTKQMALETGFILDNSQQLPEINAVLYQMHYKKNGAKLIWLDHEEENKTFAIAFKTLPSDDTGVFHILEHSLLCGSQKYPVSKPFVEMIKSSLQTFMNAFTFPDKTMYPVCSRNPKDFLNLMDVYLDAVFHPLCVTKREIFLQEGWHYELEEPDGELSCNGVVYNEMKGMYASVDTLIDSLLNRMLFPDNCYRFQSGGDPEHITELTYEEYAASYHRFYHPSNACIILDGDMDMEAVLSRIGHVLSGFERREPDCELTLQEPISSEECRYPYEIGANENAKNRVILNQGWVYGRYDEPEKNMACGVLADYLCSTNESPLRKAILEKGLGENVELSRMDGIQQPYMVLTVRNTSEEKMEEVWETVEAVLKDLTVNGLDHKRIESLLSRREFNSREKENGMYPSGLINAMRVLESSLYGGDPAQNLCYKHIFDSLRSKLEEGYFERLLQEVILENPHSGRLILYPSKTIGEERREKERERFREIKEQWPLERRKQMVSELAHLRNVQETPDSAQSLATLPQLPLEDIPEEIREIPQTVEQIDGNTVLLHRLETEGIIHISYYFSLADQSLEDLSVISFLRLLLGQTETEHYSALELQKELEGNLGRFQSYVDVYARRNQTRECTPYLVIQVSVLEEKIEEAVRLIREVLGSSRFDDISYIRSRIRQLRISMEQHVLMNGNTYAARRISADFSAKGTVEEAVQGIRMLRWVQRMDEHFEEEGAGLAESLGQLCEKVFGRGRAVLSITGDIGDEWIRRLLAVLPDIPGQPNMSCQSIRAEQPGMSHPDIRVEQTGMLCQSVRLEQSDSRDEELATAGKTGIRIPAETGFAGKGANLNICGAKYRGSMKVAARILSYGYLWEMVRVKGGAYGTGLAVSGDGDVIFTSFRDPNAENSVKCFDGAGAALRSVCESKEPIDRYIVSTIASTEPLLSARQKGNQAAEDYLSGVTRDELLKIRSEILHTSKEDLVEAGNLLDQICEIAGVCIIGGKTSLDTAGSILAQIEDL